MTQEYSSKVEYHHLLIKAKNFLDIQDEITSNESEAAAIISKRESNIGLSMHAMSQKHVSLLDNDYEKGTCIYLYIYLS